MRLSKLTLCNFGIYAGNNVFDFNCSKPVILIGGMNGRGKTTIVEAILFALYGRRSFAFEESRLSFANYLNLRTNTSDGCNATKIELEFLLSSENEMQIYCVRREWSVSAQTPLLKTSVQKNGIYDQLLSDNWDYFVEQMLPSAIAPFFFFDGEKVSDMATSKDDTYIKESIKSLLGINVIETAIDDVQRIIKRQQKNVKFDVCSIELDEYEEKLSEADKELKIAKIEAGHLDALRLQIENKLEKADNLFSSMGGSLATNRAALLTKQASLDEKFEKANGSLLEVASGSLPLLMIMPLLKKIQNEATNERLQRNIQMVLEQLPLLFRSYREKTQALFDVEDFMEYIRNNTSASIPVYNLTEDGLTKLNTLCTTLPDKLKQEVDAILVEREKILTEKAGIEHYLSVNVDDEDSKKLYKDILKYTTELATIKEQLRLAQTRVVYCSSQYDILCRQNTRTIEKAVAGMESEEEIKRILVYAGYSIEILREFKSRLQSEKTIQLASTMTDCFKKLVSKRNLLREIRIDKEKLQFQYYNEKGAEMDYSAFSAGEKQLLVIAMLWALGICSKKQFPVVIDTPLARLDSVHRKALIMNYFPKASEQIILLSTDQEIHGNMYKMLYPHIGREYTLLYDEDTKCSSIEIGYFKGQMK